MAHVGAEEIMLEAGHRALVLRDQHSRVVVLPDKGCDIYAVEDLRTGVDVLFKTPWGLRERAAGQKAPDSVAHWLQQYPGGWQLVLPNGGTEAAAQGTRWGFHGEACLVPWSCELVEGGVDATTTLFYAPLTVQRQIRLEAGRLRIAETVTNDSPDAVELMWGHHPAFGAPLVAPGARATVPARTYVADDEQPGPGITPGSRHPWPHVTTHDGIRDLSVVGAEPTAHLGYLTDLTANWFAITNPELGLGVWLRWSTGILDRAWFWQELHGSSGFPWFRRAYVMAIEPNSTIPGQGIERATAKGGVPVTLGGGERASVELELGMFHGRDPVADVDEHGQVTFTSPRDTT